VIITNIDTVFYTVEESKIISVAKLSKQINAGSGSVLKIVRYLEQLGLVEVDYKHIDGPVVKFLKELEHEFADLDEAELINKLKFFKSTEDIQSANNLLYNLYKYLKDRDDVDKEIYANVRKYYMENFFDKLNSDVKNPITKLESYNVVAGKINAEIEIIKQELSPVPFYLISLLKFSDLTRMVVDLIKDEVIGKITYNDILKMHKDEAVVVKDFYNKILDKVKDIFANLPEASLHSMCEYIVITSIGMGEIEFLLKDKFLEEVVINSADQPIWVYHKKYGWLETNILLEDEAKIVHYATLAGRTMDKTITALSPLMDARLRTGTGSTRPSTR
jgi:hypothetical protein